MTKLCYANWERYAIERIGSFILIRKLKVGGANQISSEDGKVITMDNGIVLNDLPFLDDAFATIHKKAAQFPKKVTADPRHRVIRSSSSNCYAKAETKYDQCVGYLCFLQKEKSRIHRWMITRFPSTAAEWVHKESGSTVDSDGDALLLSKCKNYTITTFVTTDQLVTYVLPTFLSLSTL